MINSDVYIALLISMLIIPLSRPTVTSNIAIHRIERPIHHGLSIADSRLLLSFVTQFVIIKGLGCVANYKGS